jgi:hypothetical protein
LKEKVVLPECELLKTVSVFSEEEIIPALTTPMHLVRLESAFRKWISILEGVIY